MAQSEYTFPQDFGTTSGYSGTDGDEGDSNDAARFGAFVGATQPISCIINGLTLSNIDYTNLLIDVDPGKFFAVTDNVDIATAGDTRSDVGFINGFSGTTGVSLSADAVNHVYVYTVLADRDKTRIEVNTSATPPSNPHVKIAEVDTATNTFSDQWRLVADDGTVTYPTESAIDEDDANGNLRAGTLVFDRSSEQTFQII